METFYSLLHRFRTTGALIAFIIALTAGLLSVVLAFHSWHGIPIAQLTRDPSAAAGMPPYTGLLSQIGIFFWGASSVICIFAATLVPPNKEKANFKRFLFFSGLFSLALWLDDAFLLHEEFLPLLGIPDITVYMAYATFMLLYLMKFYRIILRTRFILLGIALLLFSASIMVDVVPGGTHLIEDGTKFAGIVSWTCYFSWVCGVQCKSYIQKAKI